MLTIGFNDNRKKSPLISPVNSHNLTAGGRSHSDLSNHFIGKNRTPDLDDIANLNIQPGFYSLKIKRLHSHLLG